MITSNRSCGHPARSRRTTGPLRGQGHGHIIQVSSVGGVFALPGLGLYHASKWGLEGWTSSLAVEVRSFGIKVTLVEPAGYATDWQGSSAVRATQLPAYDELRANMPVSASARRGDPDATVPAILAIADAEEPPLRVFLGDQPHPCCARSTSGGSPNGRHGTTSPAGRSAEAR